MEYTRFRYLKRQFKRGTAKKVAGLYFQIDKLYAKWLEKKKGAEPIPREVFEHMIAIHNQAFPTDVDDSPYEDFLKIGRCHSYAQLHCKIIGETYLLWSEHLGFVFMNSIGTTGDFGFGMAAYMLSVLKSCNHKLIWGSVRETTTYPMIMKMKEKKMIRVLRDKIPDYADLLESDEIYHNMIIQYRKPSGKKKEMIMNTLKEKSDLLRKIHIIKERARQMP